MYRNRRTGTAKQIVESKGAATEQVALNKWRHPDQIMKNNSTRLLPVAGDPPPTRVGREAAKVSKAPRGDGRGAAGS